MNLDELANQIRAVSDDSVVQRLAKLLQDWKSDSTTVDQLRESVERYIGNDWIESTIEHENVYRLWSAFRDEVIAGIGGMTMNERLYSFGLFSRFDECETDEARSSFHENLLHGRSDVARSFDPRAPLR